MRLHVFIALSTLVSLWPAITLGSFQCECQEYRDIRWSTESIRKAIEESELVVEAEAADFYLLQPEQGVTVMKVTRAYKGSDVKEFLILDDPMRSDSCKIETPLGVNILYFGNIQDNRYWTVPHACSPSSSRRSMSVGLRQLIDKLVKET
jgi:hypothetical protein